MLLRIDADVARQFEFYGLIGRSPGMREPFDSVRRFAPYARIGARHRRDRHGRKELRPKPSTELWAAQGPSAYHGELFGGRRTLFESELWTCVRRVHGRHRHQVGLFEHADSGNIFLDEIGELPLPLQVREDAAGGRIRRGATVGSPETRKADVRGGCDQSPDLRSFAADGSSGATSTSA